MLKLLTFTPNFRQIYFKNFIQKCCDHFNEPEDGQHVKQLVFYGVKWVNTSGRPDGSAEDLKGLAVMYDAIMSYMANLTPAELVTLFPIEKRYDGNKWGIKDYFYTMAELNKIGMGSVIGSDRLFELLWDYENHDLREFLVRYMSLMSAKRRLEGRLGIAEEFCIMNGIPTYTRCEDPETGEVTFVDNKACTETRRANALKTLPWHVEIIE
ncbi:hypothetical protein SAMN02745823_03842 [Sporobacter termitidis DSM 10068]|uniref:Uncharacterized protein n=1 Tax=Sporobacter termitidis DSM 10068 TaxID=1123282 RepID=A0A1M5ZJZ7_9FIRM|nr:hypothetical protein [Sporobacter termitidis]SHI24546.1 hypothetical protein SAMN02745823_03842 [Sporobacter termitidis DSM 10068]